METIIPLGEAKTVGELREKLKDFPDDMDFGFRNQPMQELHFIDYGDYKCVVFQ